jgi:hypothetical protein
MSAMGNGQQPMPVTNLGFKIKKRNQKSLYSLFLYIHVYTQVYNYMHTYTIHSVTSIHAHQSVIQSMDKIEVACSMYSTTIWLKCYSKLLLKGSSLQQHMQKIHGFVQLALLVVEAQEP